MKLKYSESLRWTVKKFKKKTDTVYAPWYLKLIIRLNKNSYNDCLVYNLSFAWRFLAIINH